MFHVLNQMGNVYILRLILPVLFLNLEFSKSEIAILKVESQI